MFIAREFGKYGITVNAYAPGAVKTAMSPFFCLNASHPRTNIHFFQTADGLIAVVGEDAFAAVSVLWNCCAISQANPKGFLGGCEIGDESHRNHRGYSWSRVLPRL